MNILLRLKNKTTLSSIIINIITGVYLILGCFEVVPPISKDVMLQVVALLINSAYLAGILVDGTSEGMGDPDEVLEMTELRK